MNAEDINPIIEAVSTVVNNFLSKKPETGKFFKKESVDYKNGIVVSIQITGDFTGQCLLSFNNGIIKKIAASMIGMEVEVINDMVKSAITEFCNMIMGSAVTNFSEKNRSIEISAPSAVEVFSENKDIVFIGLPFWINSNENFELYLSTK